MQTYFELARCSSPFATMQNIEAATGADDGSLFGDAAVARGRASRAAHGAAGQAGRGVARVAAQGGPNPGLALALPLARPLTLPLTLTHNPHPRSPALPCSRACAAASPGSRSRNCSARRVETLRRETVRPLRRLLRSELRLRPRPGPRGH